MTQNLKTITFQMDEISYYKLLELSRRLNTNAADVLAQGMVLLSKAQGKTVIFRDPKSDIDLELKRYVK